MAIGSIMGKILLSLLFVLFLILGSAGLLFHGASNVEKINKRKQKEIYKRTIYSQAIGLCLWAFFFLWAACSIR